jgi:hypothetical protein
MLAQAAALTAGDCANSEKPLMLARFQIKSVTSIVVFRPAEYPSEVSTPLSATVESASPVNAPPTLSMTISTPRPPQPDVGGKEHPRVTLRIERDAERGGATIRLIGRMQAEHVSEVERQIEESGAKVTLDLEEVTLVDVQVVRFLGACEIRGISILNCSPYITDWIARERR